MLHGMAQKMRKQPGGGLHAWAGLSTSERGADETAACWWGLARRRGCWLGCSDPKLEAGHGWSGRPLPAVCGWG